MKSKVRAYLLKDSVETFLTTVPERKRSQFIRMYLLNEKQFPITAEAIENFYSVDSAEEKKGIDFFLNEQSLRRLDQLVKETEDLMKPQYPRVEINRSFILQLVVDMINSTYKDNPIQVVKSKRKPFYIPVSYKEALLQYINKREITSTLEQFIAEKYNGPLAEEVPTLSKKPAEKMELMQLSLDDTAIEELDEFAKEYRANRSEIFRNVVKQLICTFNDENENIQSVIYQKLDELVEDLKGIATEGQILEAIEKYQTKRN